MNLKIIIDKISCLLPSLITFTALSCGFLSIISIMNEKYIMGIFLIFLSMLMDGLDGRVARKLDASSLFGAELDSLSDMICFGVAPMLLFSQTFQNGYILLVALVYVCSTAIRLARFNLNLSKTASNNKYFTGLPCPIAAAVSISWFWITIESNLNIIAYTELTGSILLISLLSFLMISTIKFYSFKTIKPNKIAIIIFISLIIFSYKLDIAPFFAFFISIVYLLVNLFGSFLAKFTAKEYINK